MTHPKSRPGLVFGTGLGGMSKQPARQPKAREFLRPAERDFRWRDRAACAGEDTDLWFPIGETGPALLQIADAKAVCRGCPVIGSCLAWAMEAKPDGIWGGTTATERGQIKRREARERSKAVRSS
jgi:WhiB family redox-sensing transcriptional regulator